MTFIGVGLLLLLSFSVFAEEHLTEALEHANAEVYLTRSRLRIFQIAEILDLKVFSLVL
jgi:hypothetical protein